MQEEVKTRIGRTIRKDSKNERFHTTVPVKLVEKLGWSKGDLLYLTCGGQPDTMMLMEKWSAEQKKYGGVEIALCCRGDRYFYITLPTALVRFLGYHQGVEITWAIPAGRWGLRLTIP